MVNRWLPAPIFTEVVSYTAGAIRLAVNRFQINWYNRNRSLCRDSFTMVGVNVMSVGRMASCASCILAPSFLAWLP